MTTTDLLSHLIARGIKLQASGDKLRFRPADRLTLADVNEIRRHKAALLALLRAEELVHRNPFADPRPLDSCDPCGTDTYIDVPIHEGRSLRRDCARCHRFMGWPRWCGRTFDSHN